MLLFLRIISSKITHYAAIVVAVLAMLAAVRRSGKLDERNKNLQEDFKALEKKNEVHNAVNSMSDDAISKRLRDEFQRD